MEYGSMSIQRLQSGRWLNWGIRFFLTAALTASQTAGGYAPFALGCIAAAGPGADGAAALLGGVFVGVGGTFVPSLMNFGSIWGVRLTLAAWLAPTMGLRGVWLAMCVELCFRGAIFLVRLWGGRWIYTLRIKR